MLGKSVIRQSGQLWKLILALAALFTGSFAPLVPATGIGWTSGTILAIVGYAYGIFGIRCSECRCMWLWEAAKDAGWYKRLFGEPSCPACGHRFSER
jgi:hypothetical protein